MKSKKMTKSTFAIIIMAVAMVAMLAFGGTYAYFTATAKAKEVTGFKTGTVKLDLVDFSLTQATVVPGDYIVGSEQTAAEIKYTESSTTNTFVFIVIEMTITSGNLPVNKKITDLFKFEGQGQDLVAYEAKTTATKLVYGMEKTGSDTAKDYIVATKIQVDPAIESDTDQDKGTLGDYQGITFNLKFSVEQSNKLI